MFETACIEIHELDIISIYPAGLLKCAVLKYGFNRCTVKDSEVFHKSHLAEHEPVIEVEVAVEQTDILLYDKLISPFIESFIHSVFIHSENISYLYILEGCLLCSINHLFDEFRKGYGLIVYGGIGEQKCGQNK